MNEQLLKMNGLSVEILDALSFESHLGIPLKKNLHYFDKDLLITLFDRQMNNWLHDYLYKKTYPIEPGRIMREKYESGLIWNEHEFKEVLNNVLSGSERS